MSGARLTRACLSTAGWSRAQGRVWQSGGLLDRAGMGVVEQGMALSGATFGQGLGRLWFEQGVGMGQGSLSRTWLSRSWFEQGEV